MCSAADAAPFNGPYVGADVGYEHYHSSDDFTGSGVLSGYSSNNSLSLSGAVGGIYAGYGKTFDKLYLGVEAQAGLSNSDKTNKYSDFSSELKQTYNYGLSVRPGYVPIDNLLLYTRLGWEASHFEQSYSGAITGGTNVTPSAIDTGLGAEYAINANLTARLDWTYAHYQKVNITDTFNGVNVGSAELSPSSNTFSIGLAYNF